VEVTVNAYGLVVAVTVLMMVGFGSLALTSTQELRAYSDRLALHETVDGKITVTRDTWLKLLSGGLFAGNRVTQEDVAQLKAYASRLERRLVWVNVGLVSSSVLFVLLPMWWRPRSRLVVQHLVLVSWVSLALGLWAPMLTLSVHYTPPMMGRLMLESSTKGLLESIALFLSEAQWSVGVIILVFSVILPAAKLALMQWLLFRAHLGGALASWLSNVGKFSMIDVLVAALTVALFAYGSGANTDARAGSGLFYFAGYCLASLLASILLERRQKAEARERVDS
jgi:paraquat-inducible protein A